MNIKKIATAFLILFVVASVGTIVAKERNVQPTPQVAVTPATEVVETKPASPTVQEITTQAKVVAYYFHGNMRCTTCKKIEALTMEAIETGFAEEIKSGRVELKVVNVEETSNEHYIQDYQLVSRSVVVVRYEGEAQKDWKRLDAVWQLTGDKEAFIRLVQDETTALLKGRN